MRKTEQTYWDDVWKSQEALPPPPALSGYHGAINRQIRDVMVRSARALHPSPERVIEIGCGNSTWLPLLGRELHVREADGIDYSAEGCRRARAILVRDGTNGTIYEADLFDPPDSLLHRYDLAVSFGVVEHFAETAQCLRAIGRFVRIGGMVATFVPNFAGWIGKVQEWLDPEVYGMHVPLNASLLAAALRAAEMEELESGYVDAFSLGVVNARRLQGTYPGFAWRVVAALAGRGAYRLQGILGRPISGRRLSPQAYCVGIVR
jgi:SAM-dependent methyltransferase